MYTGNGATKKFAIPIGYDGRTVYLLFADGVYVKVSSGESYEISGGCVVFKDAVPYGVEVCFECPSGSDCRKMKSSSYTVIYGDGTIQHVEEDPTLLLEESRKVLADTKAYVESVRGNAARTLSMIYALGEGYSGELEGRLLGYSERAEDAIKEAAQSVRADLRHEWSSTLEEVNSKGGKISSALQTMERLKAEMQALSQNAAAETASRVRSEIEGQCSVAIEAYTGMNALKVEMQTMLEEAKYTADSAGREVQAMVSRKVNEELEMLKSLRLKMETDYEMMNTRIMNRFKLLKGGRKWNAVTRHNMTRC